MIVAVIGTEAQPEGYADVMITCQTDKPAQVRARCGRAYGTGEFDEAGEIMACDPDSVGCQHSEVSGPGQSHAVTIPSIWFSQEVKQGFCLQVTAWEPGYEHVPEAHGCLGEAVAFTVP